MKLIINILLSFLMGTISSNAQAIYEDFENWDTVPYPNPKGWFNSNAFSVASGSPISVSRCDTAYSGQHAVRIQSVKNQSTGQQFPGWVFNGSIDSAYRPTYGQPCQLKPSNFNFYFQYYPVNDDTAWGYVIFTKWNTGKQRRDTLGVGGFTIEDYTPSYSLASAGIYYFPGNDVPDTVVIAFASGIHQDSGSLLLVDRLQFKGNLIGMAPAVYNTEYEIYPNPASHTLNLTQSLLGATITDASGNHITTVNQGIVDVSAWPSGTYFILKPGCQPKKLLKY